VRVNTGRLTGIHFARCRMAYGTIGAEKTPMQVGLCRIKFRLPENMDLKGKRQVVKSIIARVQNKFNVCIAEVDDNDVWQLATLGVACISNDKRHANEILSHVVDFVNEGRFEADMLDYEIERLTAFGD
jgi:uncharacterized protein YlxP (DUF503 family)